MGEIVYVWDHGRQIGPLTLRELLEMADAGHFTPMALVRAADLEEWRPLREVLSAAATTINALSRDPICQPITFWSFVLPVGLWSLWAAMRVPALAAFAMVPTLFFAGNIIVRASEARLYALGNLVAKLSGLVGLIAVPWLLWTLGKWMFS